MIEKPKIKKNKFRIVVVPVVAEFAGVSPRQSRSSSFDVSSGFTEIENGGVWSLLFAKPPESHLKMKNDLIISHNHNFILNKKITQKACFRFIFLKLILQNWTDIGWFRPWLIIEKLQK